MRVTCFLAKQFWLFSAILILMCEAGSAQTVTTQGGSINRIPKFSGSTSLVNSNITELNGNVGIGATNPTQPLVVNGSVSLTSGGGGGGLYLRSADTDGNRNTMADPRLLHEGLISGDGSTATPWGLHIASIAWTWGQDFIYYHAGAHVFSTTIGNSPEKEVMRLTADGNLGIGTSGPGAKLEVNGNLKITSGSGAAIIFPDGTTQSTAWTGTLCGGDYAESVDISGDRTWYEPGDVLVIDPAKPGKFLKSDKPYSRLVAGIYSTKPGIVGRRQTTDPKESNNEVPMAMVGIVPTKVSSENGPIEVGDLLVTSSTLGRAMRADDGRTPTGTVIGKALGKLELGIGVIEVLVSLQ